MGKENLPFYRLHPLYILLLPLFFVIHGHNENYGLIEYSIPAVYLGYYLNLAALLFFSGNVVYGDFKKSGCWATFLPLIFFLFGTTYDFFKILHFPGFFISYRFLLPVTGIFFIAGTFFPGRRANRQLYISQLVYTNTWIKKPVLAANRKFERPRVVIQKEIMGTGM